jgi:uncharacterized protein YodC (DUF2158 family)
MQKKFEEGDRVKPRHGGEPMVIDQIQSSFAVCLVLTENGLERRPFPVSMLVPAGDEDGAGPLA